MMEFAEHFISSGLATAQARRLYDSWHGRTKANNADAYLQYLFKSGIPAHRVTPGNKGAWVMRRIEGDVAHFITLSFWESYDAIVSFAGADLGVAKYFPEDEKYLLEFASGVTHYELFV
jgi:hypothetical protein